MTFFMPRTKLCLPILLAIMSLFGRARAAELPAPVRAPYSVAAPLPQQLTYVLAPNDLVQVKVYQEDDLETKMRISKDGTSSFPLIGVVHIGGKTVEQASN